MIWWPRAERIAIGRGRVWESTMLSRKDALPPYPDKSSEEDTPVVARLMRERRLALLDAPQLYLHVRHGGNTFGESHFERQWALADSQFEGVACAAILDVLTRFFSFRDYPIQSETLYQHTPETRATHYLNAATINDRYAGLLTRHIGKFPRCGRRDRRGTSATAGRSRHELGMRNAHKMPSSSSSPPSRKRGHQLFPSDPRRPTRTEPSSASVTAKQGDWWFCHPRKKGFAAAQSRPARGHRGLNGSGTAIRTPEIHVPGAYSFQPSGGLLPLAIWRVL